MFLNQNKSIKVHVNLKLSNYKVIFFDFVKYFFVNALAKTPLNAYGKKRIM
jgi:hypothetical protein